MKVNQANLAKSASQMPFPTAAWYFPLGIKHFPSTTVYNSYQFNSNRAIKSNILWKKVKVNKYLHFRLSLAAIATDIQLGNKHEDCQMLSANRWSKKLSERKRLPPGNQTILLQQLWFECIHLQKQSPVKFEWRASNHSHHHRGNKGEKIQTVSTFFPTKACQHQQEPSKIG